MSGWRYYAVDALSGEVIDSDLDITVIGRTCELSGPGSFVAHADPDTGQLRDSFGRIVLDEWSTLLYAENDDILRWGGIVHELRYEGPRLVIEAAGVSSYAHGMPFLDSYSATNVDAADVIRMIWAHLQSFDGGNLGVQVVGKAGVLVGDGFTEKMREGAERERNPDGTFKPIREDQKERIPTPYELQWWNSPDCGREVTRLLGDGSFEYAERYEWADAAKTAIKHTIAIAPRIGTYRDKLRFVQGENVVDSTPVTFSGSVWASEVHLIGAGEGDRRPASTRRHHAGRARLPRPVGRRGRIHHGHPARERAPRIVGARRRHRRRARRAVGRRREPHGAHRLVHHRRP